jgi:hypothetical protein
MRFVEKRVYAGAPNERATVDTTEQNGGAVTVTLDGAVVSEDVQFPLSSAAGGERRIEISLVGAKGAFCVVGVSPVDGATDPDLLLCTASNPAPVHVYRFLTPPAAAMAAFARAGDGPTPTAPSPRKSTAKPPRKPTAKRTVKPKRGRP